MLVAYFIILVPWFLFFSLMGSGMAFEGGDTAGAYAFVANAWAYPIFVAVAWFARRRKPVLMWLPIAPLILAASAFVTNWP